MLKRITGILLAAGMAVFMAGCGGGHGPSDNLVSFRPGLTWTYDVAGTVTLPSSLGGGTQALQTSSKLTMMVASDTSRDLNNDEVNILDRKFDLFLLDGREIKGNFRLYFNQTTLGVFVHGMNNYVGDTFNASNDKFVPSTTNPAFKFLYIPNPATDGLSLSYTNPFGITTNTDVSYQLQFGSVRQSISTPAGEFFAKGVSIKENFSKFLLTSSGIVPDTGIVSGAINATLPDGTKITGTIALRSVN